VVADGIFGLGAGAGRAVGSHADAEQAWIEQPLLRVGVHFEQDRQPVPDRLESLRVLADLIEGASF
jgi:hypothetical protein